MTQQPEGQASTGHERQYHARSMLPVHVYRFRMLGMLLGSLPIAVVLDENGWSPFSVALLAFTALLWPHLARWLTRRSADPFRSELHCLLVDSLIAGLWVPLMHFNLLPSALLLAVTTADKISTGVRGLWLRSLPAMALGVLAGGAATGFAVALPSSVPVVVACLPLLVLHTLAVSLGTYRLIWTIQKRNRQLEELSRQDPLTGLANRRHWQGEAARMLRERGARGDAATLLMIDVDRFKAINDRHGHGAGDDVLCRLAALIRQHAGASALAGRLGGDEFAVALPCGLGEAELLAERLRHALAAATWPHRPELRCTISLGLTETGEAENTLPDWSEAADRALYRAKQSGRNRIASGGHSAS